MYRVVGKEQERERRMVFRVTEEDREELEWYEALQAGLGA